MTTSYASWYSQKLIAQLLAAGLTDFVLSPGSRSQSLALELAAREQAGEVKLHVVIDERAAGFIALGIAQASHRQVAVITTSGSAVANLMPAVAEAAHAGIPLILITADRPEELLGIGANQTTVQKGIFGEYVAEAIEVPAASSPVSEAEISELVLRLTTLAGDWRPRHLNLAFREPLSGPVAGLDVPGSISHANLSENPAANANTASSADASPSAEVPHNVQLPAKTLVLAGDKAGEAANEFALKNNLPLIAEVSSGARYGANLISHWRTILQELELRPEAIVIFGHPTLSREQSALLQDPKIELISVAGRNWPAFNPGSRANLQSGEFGSIDFASASQSEAQTESQSENQAANYLMQLIMHDRKAKIASETQVQSTSELSAAQYARHELGEAKKAVSRADLVAALWRHTWPHDRLFFGASRLIRVADRVVGGKKIPVYSNRGLSGIDGNIATAIGIALASGAKQGGRTRALIGDITALHDISSLQYGKGLMNLQLIIGNDGGGSLFDLLEVAGTAEPEQFERVLFTPQNEDFQKIAQAFGWHYSLVQTRAELESALSFNAGPLLIEVKLARREDG